MKAKFNEILTVVLFCAFLGIMGLVLIFGPKAGFSELEKRYLEEFPELTWESLSSGEFGEGFETFLADHIPGRDFFVGLNAYVDLLTGRQVAQDIYLAAGDRLVEAPVAWNDTAIVRNMTAINTFAQSVQIPVDLMIVPSAGWAFQDEILGLSDPYTDQELIRRIYEMAGEDLRCQDVTDLYEDGEGLYYRTDHHWTSLGAYRAYASYMQSLGRMYREQADFSVETVQGFYGSTYSRAALWLMPSEPLELWTGSTNITVTNGESDQIHQGIFYTGRLEETDKYTVYLDGNHSIVRVHNPDAAGSGKLLVIRDSYSNCLGGFLAESYEEVVLVDLRYFKQSISELCQQEGFDNILICYSLGNFMTDTNIIWLR